MPKTLDEFIWFIFLILLGALGWLGKSTFKKMNDRMEAIENNTFLTAETCATCLTKKIAEAVKDELEKAVDLFSNKISVIEGKQDELRTTILPEKYARRDDLKTGIGDLKERMSSIDDSLKFLIEEGFKNAQRKKTD